MTGAPPARLGRYRIMRELGRGGMGVVYEAQDEQLGRTLAVKTLAGLADETARKRFWREARAAASVNHPNICPLYEVGGEGGLPFIAMGGAETTARSASTRSIRHEVLRAWPGSHEVVSLWQHLAPLLDLKPEAISHQL